MSNLSYELNDPSSILREYIKKKNKSLLNVCDEACFSTEFDYQKVHRWCINLSQWMLQQQSER